jgi:hypothetical protein
MNLINFVRENRQASFLLKSELGIATKLQNLDLILAAS